ncbi:MAG: hypothetical protein IT342_11425 [Candidatus Melainabacteria bacterium]|nr:hypothetical protein [Candidatus Melainabacteria bacterium]
MKTRFQRALLSCLFVQTFVAASMPVMAMEPTYLNVGPGNNLSVTIDGPLPENQLQIDQSEHVKTSSVVVDDPKGWDQIAPASTPIKPVLRVNQPNSNHKKVENPAKPKTLGLATLPCAAVDSSETNLTIVDNDLEKEKELRKEETFTSQTTDASGVTKITSGARFSVSVLSSHSSHTAKVNDPVEARRTASSSQTRR